MVGDVDVCGLREAVQASTHLGGGESVHRE